MVQGSAELPRNPNGPFLGLNSAHRSYENVIESSNVSRRTYEKNGTEQATSRKTEEQSAKFLIDANRGDSEKTPVSSRRPWNKRSLGLVLRSCQQEDEVQVSTLQTMHDMLSLTGTKVPLLK